MSGNANSRARRKMKRELKILSDKGELGYMNEPSDTRNTDEIAAEKWAANKSQSVSPRLPRKAAMVMWNKWMSEQEII